MQPVVLFLTNTRCSIAHCPDSLLDLIDSRTAYLHNEGTDTRAKPSEYNVVDREVEWDGYVRFLRRGQKTMWPWVPLGLRDIVAWTLYEAQVPYEVQDSRTAPEPYPEFVQRYSTPIPLRPHQEACKAAMLESYDCAAVMPPRAGKTRTLFEVVRQLALPTLWVAPTTNIVDQTVAAAHEFFAPFDAVQVTSKTQYDVKDALLTVCTAGALPTLNKDFLESRHHLVSDEVHHFLAQKAWGSTLLEHTPHIAHRKGMTGTFFRSNGDDLALHAYVSRIAYQVQSKELEEKGYLVPCYSTFVGLKGPRVQAGRGRAFNAPDGHGTKGIQNHSFRNDVVASVAKHLTDTGRRVLVLVWTKKQGNLILDRLRPFFPPSGPMQKLEPVEFVSTNRHKQAIREILEDFRSHGTVKVLIGTSMIGEGTDLPPADALVYAAGGKAKVQLTQAWYRVITKTEDKQYAVIVDFTDEHHPKLRDHARQRWGVMAQDPIFRMSHCPDLPAFQAWCQHLAPWSPEG